MSLGSNGAVKLGGKLAQRLAGKVDHVLEHRQARAQASVAPALGCGYEKVSRSVLAELHNPPELVRRENCYSKFRYDHVAYKLLYSIKQVLGNCLVLRVEQLLPAGENQIEAVRNYIVPLDFAQ